MTVVTLDTNQAHVHCHFVGQVGADEYAGAWATLSVDERRRAERFAFPRDRERFVLAHGLLRRALSRYGPVSPEEWRFVFNQFGKPSVSPGLTSTGVEFNLSHTDGLIACVVSRHDVGIDVESIDRQVRDREVAARFFSPVEAEGLEQCDEQERSPRFFELWTLKEAYVKGLGAGLSHPLERFSFGLCRPASIEFEAEPTTDLSWYFALWTPSPRHRMALAIRVGRSVPPLISFFDQHGRPVDAPRLLRDSGAQAPLRDT